MTYLESNMEEFAIDCFGLFQHNYRSIEEDFYTHLGVSPLEECERSSDFSDHRTNASNSAEASREESRSQIESEVHSSGQENRSEVERNSSSKHHNFQKHTVTSLREIISYQNLAKFCEDQTQVELVLRLWREFLMIRGKTIMTKKFLYALFGTDLKSVTQLSKYGFKELLAQHEGSLHQIVSAKNELRKCVIRLYTDQTISEHVNNREIKRKQEFKLYLMNFREELQNGKIKKRISKESSEWIHKNAEMSEYLN